MAYEAEWEKAARGGSKSPFPRGGSPVTCLNAVIETDGCRRGLSWPRNSFVPDAYAEVYASGDIKGPLLSEAKKCQK